MLTISDLEKINQKPKINQDVSLKLIADFYLNTIAPKNYYFLLDDKTNINLRFSKEHFCHLMAIHYFCPDPSLEHQYKSHGGFYNIINNQLTFDSLKSLNKEKFKEYKERMQYFPFIYQILNNCNTVKFDKDLVDGKCKIDVEFLLYNTHDNKKMHLGINLENSNKDIYFAKSFFISKSNKINKYTDGQKKLEIIDKKISKISNLKF